MYIREGHERRGTNSPNSKYSDLAEEENPDMKAGFPQVNSSEVRRAALGISRQAF
jgi:hypothetical protein